MFVEHQALHFAPEFLYLQRDALSHAADAHCLLTLLLSARHRFRRLRIGVHCPITESASDFGCGNAEVRPHCVLLPSVCFPNPHS